MLVKVRRDKNMEWGFLEKYSSYSYKGKGYVKALVGINIEKGCLSPVFVYKEEKFVPLSTIEETVGIDKYIKAKKPFYSKIKTGFIVELKASVNFVTKEYYPNESSFEVYTVNGPLNTSTGQMPFKKVLDVPLQFRRVVEGPLRLLGESFGDRSEFLRSRLWVE